MKIVIEYEEIVTMRTVVNCTDLQVARELFESGARPHIREGWVSEASEVIREVDWDSGTFWVFADPPKWIRERGW